ncbi:hypothetical protein GGP79_002337 [Salinibacter ruber]|uniref:sulfotransferase family protein n=1 Tax=Salinibacter ruber TaxID=146919 RepID=UPI0021674448|nr:sulfotransferase family protein [Salinibacter ruber]MCS3754373.1 hypothetical protein [Salinibacter ruber]
MLVSHRHNFIYTKTFKTAGTSVEAFFEPFCIPAEKTWTFSHARAEQVSDAGVVGYRGSNYERATWWNHMPAADIRDRLGPSTWESYFKFCVVRNPFDKAVSNFYFGQKRSFEYTSQYFKGRIRSALRTASRRFLRFEFERWLEKGALNVDRDKYMIDGDICMDDFIFFERLEDDVRRISSHLGLPFDGEQLPRLKSGTRPDRYSTNDHYTARSKEIVAEAFDVEIDLFGYSFPAPQASAAPSVNPALT